jgi:chromosome segregation ATPase
LSEVTEAMEGARIEKVEAERVRDELRQLLEVQVQRTDTQAQRTAEVEELLSSEKEAHVEARREHEAQVAAGRALRSAMGDCLGDLQRSLASLEAEAAVLKDARRRTGEAATAILESKETLHAAAERQQDLLTKLSEVTEEQTSEIVGASREVNVRKDGLIETVLEADKQRLERELAAHTAFNIRVAADVNEAVERSAKALEEAAAAASAASTSLGAGVSQYKGGQCETWPIVFLSLRDVEK